VLRAEQEILRESVYPLTRLRQNLHEFDLVLETLHSMMLEVTETADVRALRGGEVLRALHQRSQTGVPDVQACMQRLLFHCHQVLFNQIGAWIVSGRLSDPLGEFFIEMVQDGADGGAGAAVAAAAAAAAAAPAAAGDELEESSVAGGAGDHVSSFRKSPRMPSAPATAAAAAAARGLASSALVHQLPWNAQYRLRQSMVPHSYLPLPLAHRILFIGQAVSLLQHPAVQRFGSQLTHNDLLSFARAVHQLKQMPVFDVVRVGLVMEEIRSVVTSHLWDLVVKKGELVAHLTALKSFFLVGHGEFFQAFIEAVHQRDMFKLEPTERAEPDVRAGPFLAAAIACGIEDWEFFRNLDIRIEPSMFFFKAFLPKHVSSYGNAKPNSIVLAGSAQHVSAAHALSLTAGGAARQVGGIWYSSRKSLDQGFETSFRFQLVHEALAPGGAAAPASPSKGPLRQQPGGGTRFDFGAARADAAPSVRSGESGSGEGSVARQQLTWLASTKGFSFVVQNAGMGALPSVTKHEWDGRDDAELANVVQAEDAAGARAVSESERV
jgi:gamma-tubulin complex component 4